MVVIDDYPEERQALQSSMLREFEMKDLGPPKYSLGKLPIRRMAYFRHRENMLLICYMRLKFQRVN